MIKLINLTKNYINKNNALNEVSLEFNNSGFISILGPSGCGKTTLLNIIGGLDKDFTGQMLINNIDFRKLSNKLDGYRNNSVGFVFQDFNLINHLNVFDNIALSLKLSREKNKLTKMKVLESLKTVGLEGYEKKKVNELSGGEAQRVAIARAIVNNPKIILCDEPTGSLDTYNSKNIVKLLKKLSENKLVIMVTHNTELAYKYSDRIIELLDGKVVKDETFSNNNKTINSEIKKTHLSLFTSLKLSYKNILTKKFRTLLTIFAGSIGVIAIGLVLTLSSGVKKYINEIQEKALIDKPIVISSNTIYQLDGNINNDVEEYPNSNEIIVKHYNTSYEHNSNMDDCIVKLVKNLDETKYNLINYNRKVNFTIYSKQTYDKAYSTYFNEMNDKTIMEYEYDLISGSMPTKYNEIALVVDKYNSINSTILKSLGLDYEQNKYKFSDIIGKEYFLIGNDDLYEYDIDKGYFKTKKLSRDGNYETLTITAIIRESKDNTFSLYSQGIVYTKELTDYVIEKAKESEIGKMQLLYGINKNVLTGEAFTDYIGESVTYTKEYLYEEQLKSLSLVEQITNIQIYTSTFEDRKYIENYIKESDEFKNITNINYRDYMSSIAEDFATFINILTKVLLIFALISLFVSAIMITIITYISVLEREKEIGILRCIGTRKMDISLIFCSENIIIGLGSGILGIIISYIIKSPINRLVQNIIKENVSLATSVTNQNLIKFKPGFILLLIMFNIIITVLAGVIPAIYASIKNPVNTLKSR